MNDLIDTTEMYLRIIFELEEEGVTPLRARIAERLHQSGPTVSQTVARMERDGLLTVQGDRHLELTDVGRKRATSVMRKHRLAECLLVQVIGLEYQQAHVEACRWEHVMSDQVERKVFALLGGPTVSPYGNPIPGLTEFADSTTQATEDRPEPPSEQDGAVAGDSANGSATAPASVPLTDVLVDGEVVIDRLSEMLLDDVTLVDELSRAGVRPGATVTMKRTGHDVELYTRGEPVRVVQASARLVFVSAG